MIPVGREKVVSISQYRKEDGGDIYLYFTGLDTLRNPVVAVKGKPESMGELGAVMDELLGVNVMFDKAGD